jgi:hypothetical protein
MVVLKVVMKVCLSVVSMVELTVECLVVWTVAEKDNALVDC